MSFAVEIVDDEIRVCLPGEARAVFSCGERIQSLGGSPLPLAWTAGAHEGAWSASCDGLPGVTLYKTISVEPGPAGVGLQVAYEAEAAGGQERAFSLALMHVVPLPYGETRLIWERPDSRSVYRFSRVPHALVSRSSIQFSGDTNGVAIEIPGVALRLQGSPGPGSLDAWHGALKLRCARDVRLSVAARGIRVEIARVAAWFTSDAHCRARPHAPGDAVRAFAEPPAAAPRPAAPGVMREALLAAIRGDGEALAGALEDVDDLEHLWRLARQHRVAQCLAPTLGERWTPRSSRAAALLERARAHARSVDRFVREGMARVSELRETLSRHGIRIFPMKGLELALHYYPEPGLRYMGDFDLLAHGSDAPRIAACLEQPLELGGRIWAHYGYHLFDFGRDRIDAEIHFFPWDRRYLPDYPLPEGELNVFERALPWLYQRWCQRERDPEASMVALLLNACKSSLQWIDGMGADVELPSLEALPAFRLSDAADIFFVLRGTATQLDWSCIFDKLMECTDDPAQPRNQSINLSMLAYLLFAASELFALSIDASPLVAKVSFATPAWLRARHARFASALRGIGEAPDSINLLLPSA